MGLLLKGSNGFEPSWAGPTWRNYDTCLKTGPHAICEVPPSMGGCGHWWILLPVSWRKTHGWGEKSTSGVSQKHGKKGQRTIEMDEIKTYGLLYTYSCCDFSQNKKSTGGVDPIYGWGERKKEGDKGYKGYKNQE